MNFDANGNYTNTTKDNWFRNFFVGTKGRVLNSDGSVKQKFKFADPKNDAKDIESGIINKLVFVSDGQMKSMVAASGGFDSQNKTANRSWGDRFGYIRQEGKGGGKMDFSYTQIPKTFPGASSDPLNIPSSLVFLVPPSGDGEAPVAHNQMNFGNYMFGLSGEAQGFSLLELSYGAHYNSVVNSTENNYAPQLDSRDDQFSIEQGYKYGQVNWYDRKVFSVSPGTPQPQPKLIEPTTR